jgi:hypothetical protein
MVLGSFRKTAPRGFAGASIPDIAGIVSQNGPAGSGPGPPVHRSTMLLGSFRNGAGFVSHPRSIPGMIHRLVKEQERGPRAWSFVFIIGGAR